MDIGSGCGTMVLSTAAATGAKTIGIEYCPKIFDQVGTVLSSGNWN